MGLERMGYWHGLWDLSVDGSIAMFQIINSSCNGLATPGRAVSQGLGLPIVIDMQAA
jgi:hypothetical protein